MSKPTNADNQKPFKSLTERFSEVLTDIQWIVIERRFLYSETHEHIGGEYLGVASSRVRQIERNALEEINGRFRQEMEELSEALEKQLSVHNGELNIKDYLTTFPGISEDEFNILLSACREKKD